MKPYFGSKPKETTLLKEQGVFWIYTLDCGFKIWKRQGLLCNVASEGVSRDLDRWIEIGRWGFDPVGEREVAS